MIQPVIENLALDGGRRQTRACRRPDPLTAQRHKGWPALVLCLFVILLLVGTLSARYGNPAAGAGPVSRGTVPPSSYGKGPQTQNTAFGDPSGLVSTPNPIDNTSNLVITGNVSGGKSFRGNIPYGSTTSFGGRLGSTSLDPFLRYSAMPEELSQGPSTSNPFYSPTGTVPKIQPGYSGVFAPGSPKVAVGVMQSQAEQPADIMPASDTLQLQVPAGRTVGGIVRTEGFGDGPLPSSGRPQASLEGAAQLWSRSPDEMRRLVAGEPGVSLSDRRPLAQTKQLMTSEEYQRQLEQLQRDLDRVKTNASEFEQNLKTGRQPSVQPMAQKPAEAVPPLYSAEALRRIIQPQSQPPRPSAPMNPPAGQDLLPPLATLAPDGSATPGQTQDQTAAGLPDAALVSPQVPPAGARAGASPESRLLLYGQPAGLAPSLSEAQKSRIDALFAPQTGGAAPERGSDIGSRLPAMQRVEETARAFDAPADIIQHPLQGSTGNVPSSTAGGDGISPFPSPSQPLRTEPALSTVERTQGNASLQGGAPQGQESIFGGPGVTQPGNVQPKSPGLSGPLVADRTAPKSAEADSVSQEKFDRYMKSAQLYLQQGQYSGAAESFALACVYDPRDARPQIGRSHALLAAGEYRGSAVCLAKAIELDPRYTLRKLDLIEAVGGPDQFVQRITDLQQRAKTSNAPGLQLLLAYIYQQMDRPEEATAAVRAAKKGLPSSRSVNLLEAAIEGVAPG